MSTESLKLPESCENTSSTWWTIIKEKGLTVNQLKLIAIMTMFLDHFAATILTYFQSQAGISQQEFLYFQIAIVTLRSIGRLAFPIFAYLIVNGFYHTSSKRDYFLRLLTFAVISEIFFDFGLFGDWFVFSHQNVFFTLSLGLLAIWVYDELKSKKTMGIVLGSFVVFLIGLLSSVIRCDYDIYGIFTIFFMYLFYHQFKRMSVAIILFNLVIFWSNLLVWPIIPNWFMGSYGWTLEGISGFVLQLFTYVMMNAQLLSIFALCFIKSYKGEKGKGLNKYVFYAFYPVHIFLLGLILLVIKSI